MEWADNDEQIASYSNTDDNGSGKSLKGPDSTDTGTMTEVNALREGLFQEEISTRRKRNSSSFPGCEFYAKEKEFRFVYGRWSMEVKAPTRGMARREAAGCWM